MFPKRDAEDGEQAFFAMLWHPGTYGLLSRHYWIERIEQVESQRGVRVCAGKRFARFADIEPELWRITSPVPGIDAGGRSHQNF